MESRDGNEKRYDLKLIISVSYCTRSAVYNPWIGRLLKYVSRIRHFDLLRFINYRNYACL